MVYSKGLYLSPMSQQRSRLEEFAHHGCGDLQVTNELEATKHPRGQNCQSMQEVSATILPRGMGSCIFPIFSAVID